LPGDVTVFDAPEVKKIDDDRKADQDKITNLTAQNKKYEELMSSWSPGWKTLTITLISGVALGWYLHDKF